MRPSQRYGYIKAFEMGFAGIAIRPTSNSSGHSQTGSWKYMKAGKDGYPFTQKAGSASLVINNLRLRSF